MKAAYILDAVRTPRGEGNQGRAHFRGFIRRSFWRRRFQQIAVRTGIEPSDVEDVVVGCVSQAGEQGANVARNAVLTSGWPIEIPAVSLNRFCASGLQAVNFAAMGVASGAQDVVVAGGVESMSRAPMGSDGGGADGNNLHLREKHFQVPQGISADLIASREGFSREDVDRFALESQKRAAAAQKDGRFSKSLFPVKDPVSGKVVLEIDEHPRPEATLEGLASLDPAFAKLGGKPVGPNGETMDQLALGVYPEVKKMNHVHTAGNSSGIVDGAGVVMLASEDYVKAHGLKPRARVRAIAAQGSEPVIMLTAPAPTSKKALAKAGMKSSDVDLWEINEAFATECRFRL